MRAFRWGNLLSVFMPLLMGIFIASRSLMRIRFPLSFALFLQACAAPVVDSSSDGFAFIEREGLPRLLQLSDSVFTGGQPVAPGFAALGELGIRTIVNVDGATPNLEAAKAAGLNYFHIPIGYQGIPDDASLSLERLAREEAGPFYIHCHHGKHRGPAAAAVVLRVLEEGNREASILALQIAGTSLDYPGLWETVGDWEPAPAGSVFPDLVSVATIDDFQGGMAEIDRIWDRLKLVRKFNWEAPDRHPDLVPELEARRLSESLFDCFQVSEEMLATDPEFNRMALEAIAASRKLRAGVEMGDFQVAEEGFRGSKQSCKGCHNVYRQ